MSERVAGMLFALKCVELLCALSVLVLAFASPDHIFLAVNLFGVLVAVSAAIILAEGTASSRLLSRSGPIHRVERPIRYWTLFSMNVVALIIGLALTQLPIG
jgi:hypothetical protein